MPDVPEAVRARSLMVWSQIFGCISFELFGHYKGTVRNANRFFAFVVDEAAEPRVAARVIGHEKGA